MKVIIIKYNLIFHKPEAAESVSLMFGLQCTIVRFVLFRTLQFKMKVIFLSLEIYTES